MDLRQSLGLSAALEELLTCPVCLVMPRNKLIYTCPNGHLLCEECRAALRSSCCPVCRSKTRGWTRALLAEQILERVPLPCRFKFLGNLLPVIERSDKLLNYGASAQGFKEGEV